MIDHKSESPLGKRKLETDESTEKGTPPTKKSKTERFDAALNNSSEPERHDSPLSTIEGISLDPESAEDYFPPSVDNSPNAKELFLSWLQKCVEPVIGDERRIDSLARLLEGIGVCIADCLIEKELFISGNVLKDIERGEGFASAHAKLVIEILQHLLTCSKLDSIDEHSSNERQEQHRKDIELLVRICRTSINAARASSNFSDPRIQINDETLRNVITNLTKDKTQRSWVTQGLDYFANSLHQNEQEAWHRVKDRDANELTPVELKEAEKLKHKINQIQLTYEFIWRLVRDYKKVKHFFQKNRIEVCNLLSIGKKGEHAEVRLLGYLLETGKIAPPKESASGDTDTNPFLYLGLSKLCCAHCISAIHTINEVLRANMSLIIGTQDEAEIINPADLAECAEKWRLVEQELVDEIEKEEGDDKIVKTGGHHGLHFKNWRTPDYLLGKVYLSTNSKLMRFSSTNRQVENIRWNIIDQRFYEALKTSFENTLDNLEKSIVLIKRSQLLPPEKATMRRSPSFSNATPSPDFSPERGSSPSEGAADNAILRKLIEGTEGMELEEMALNNEASLENQQSKQGLTFG